MAKPFAPTAAPENAALTAALVNRVLDQVTAGDIDGAVETLHLVDPAAGPEYTRQLNDYLVGVGLEALLPA